MAFVQPNTPEAANGSVSGGVRVNRHFSVLLYGIFLNALILLIAIILGFIVSMRAGIWFGVPVFVAWNLYVLWLLRFSSHRWVVAACADRIYVRLLMAPSAEEHVILFSASEIASISIKTVEVFVYGPNPKLAEWLVIEPVQAITEIVPSQFLLFLEDVWMHDSGNTMRVGILKGGLTIGWEWCHPGLRAFLQQVVRECPSVFIAPEEHSELDLNGIWKGREKPDAQQRQMLAQAKRLGFGGECAQRLSQYKHMSLQEAAAYLTEIEREEAGTGQAVAQQ